MGYDLLSSYYDELVRFDYDGYFDFVKTYFPQKGAALDLCSGTGTFALKLAENGFNVTCVDASSQMLAEAAKKARSARRKLLFLQADVNELKTYGKYNLVTSTCDGLNYVKNQASLKGLFEKIYDALLLGGVFVFDVSTRHKAQNVLSGQTFFEDTPTYTLFWSARDEGEGKIGTDVSVFTKSGDVYLRSDGFFVQHFYPNELFVGLLKEIGFDVSVFDGEKFAEITEQSNRMLVVARKV